MKGAVMKESKKVAVIEGNSLVYQGTVIAVLKGGKVTTPDGAYLGEALFEVGKALGFWVIWHVQPKPSPKAEAKAAKPKPAKKTDPHADRRRALERFASSVGGRSQTRQGFVILTLPDTKGKEGTIRVNLADATLSADYPKDAGISQRSRCDFLVRMYQAQIAAAVGS